MGICLIFGILGVLVMVGAGPAWWMKTRIWLVALLGLLVAGRACAGTAVVEVKGLVAGSKMSGTFKFEEKKDGTTITGTLSKAPMGKHGIHIHTESSCQETGGHLNPSNGSHGYWPKDYPLHAHPGDLGNIEVDDEGNATFKLHMPDIGLAARSRYNIRKRTLVITEKEDDFSQPDGNGGAPIACGAIEER